MTVKRQNDERFFHITDCRMLSLYKRVPDAIGGWLLEIRYYKDDEKFIPNRTTICIDQSKFGSEFIEFMNGKHERLYYTDGMGDIDVFKRGNDYIFYVSPNDGIFQYFMFSKKEFDKLLYWLKLDV